MGHRGHPLKGVRIRYRALRSCNDPKGVVSHEGIDGVRPENWRVSRLRSCSMHIDWVGQAVIPNDRTCLYRTRGCAVREREVRMSVGTARLFLRSGSQAGAQDPNNPGRRSTSIRRLKWSSSGSRHLPLRATSIWHHVSSSLRRGRTAPHGIAQMMPVQDSEVVAALIDSRCSQ